MFIHGADYFIDMPEESAMQLARSCTKSVLACLFTHWPLDHTQGLRALEMNMDWLAWNELAILPLGILAEHPLAGVTRISPYNPLL